MADMGKASKAVVLDLVKNIQQFNEIVTKEIKDIQKDATDLSSCWNDPQYKDFLAFTTEITKQLQSDIATLDTVEKNLKIKADKF